DKFIVAMTVLMAIIALGQLVISIAMLSANRRRAIKNWLAWRVDAFTFALLMGFGVTGLVDFLLTKGPEKWDYYRMAASMACLAMANGIWICGFLMRYSYGLSKRIERLESLILDPSEYSTEDRRSLEKR